jgi:hypothetical protein
VKTEIEKEHEQDEALLGQLKEVRINWESQWKLIEENLLPNHPIWFRANQRSGDRKNLSIIDSTACLALDDLRAGMMSGITNPARPWFKMLTPYSALNAREDVQKSLYETEQAMYGVLLKSNFYESIQTFYDALAGFGTAAMYVEEDMETSVNFVNLPIGTYWISDNSRGDADVIYRELSMTVRQLLETFGEVDGDGNYDMSKFSDNVKGLCKSNMKETSVDVTHVIKPNKSYRTGAIGKGGKRYSSSYYESGLGASEKKYLKQGGIDNFPVLVARWSRNPEDAYGTNCPGMKALGDIRQLQIMTKKHLRAVEKIVDGPVNAPESLRNKGVTQAPGGVNWVSDSAKGVTPVQEMRIDLSSLEATMAQVRYRIERAFFADVLRMMLQQDYLNERGPQKTATEINAMKQQLMTIFGPITRILDKVFDKMIDLVFDIMVKRGLIPEWPEDVRGVNLDVEYISIMAQAQKLDGLAFLERMVMFATSVAQVSPSSLAKINFDSVFERAGEALGMHPATIRSDEEAAAIRKAEAEAQQAKIDSERAKAERSSAAAAKTMSETDVNKDSALSRLMDQNQSMSPVNP